MKTELQSISKIFIEKLFRIADYQRGYAWTEKQLKEFWSDLTQLHQGHNHYVGVLTLEDVPRSIYEKWEEDSWIIESKSFVPYYIVDGQQRLTTSIILIQAITETIEDADKLNYSTKDEIRKKFIFDTKDEGISRSYIFGYEKDNPSYEYLKTKIFNEITDSAETPQETIYTQNLAKAKAFFAEELQKLTKEEIEFIYRKITQNFLFNIYSISEEIDTYVAFETMNNRGKPLSYLELLKNRLIYLSTKFDDSEQEKTKLRSAINEAWKSIYHFLGKNKDKPLDDDLFLLNHYLLYFDNNALEENTGFSSQQVRRRRINYQEFLLGNYFSSKAITNGKNSTIRKKLKVVDVYKYVKSLKVCVEIWYKILNPQESNFSKDVRFWLEKLNRLGIENIAPLVMVFMQKENNEKKIVLFLKILEKYAFLIYSASSIYSPNRDIVYFRDIASEYGSGNTSSDNVISNITARFEYVKKETSFISNMKELFRTKGFYVWDTINYFLFEYELDLKSKSKTNRDKLDWNVLLEYEFSDDYYTIEHIYPQNSMKPHWTSKFKEFNTKERTALKHSLGNLLPLSKPKNCSLQDRPFEEKKGRTGPTVGFRYGSYSEIQVSEYEEWTAVEILERGIMLLDFLEHRWSIPLGNRAEKINILGLKSAAERIGYQ